MLIFLVIYFYSLFFLLLLLLLFIFQTLRIAYAEQYYWSRTRESRDRNKVIDTDWSWREKKLLLKTFFSFVLFCHHHHHRQRLWIFFFLSTLPRRQKPTLSMSWLSWTFTFCQPFCLLTEKHFGLLTTYSLFGCCSNHRWAEKSLTKYWNRLEIRTP